MLSVRKSLLENPFHNILKVPLLGLFAQKAVGPLGPSLSDLLLTVFTRPAQPPMPPGCRLTSLLACFFMKFGMGEDIGQGRQNVFAFVFLFLIPRTWIRIADSREERSRNDVYSIMSGPCDSKDLLLCC